MGTSSKKATRQKGGRLRVAEHHRRICRHGPSSLRWPPEIAGPPADLRPISAPRVRACYDYRHRCAELAARSVQKVRRLSKNSEKLL